MKKVGTKVKIYTFVLKKLKQDYLLLYCWVPLYTVGRETARKQVLRYLPHCLGQGNLHRANNGFWRNAFITPASLTGINWLGWIRRFNH